MAATAARPAAAPAVDLAPAIRAELLARAGSAGRGAVELAAFYRSNDYSARWLDVSARLNPAAAGALQVLASADDDGLDPAEYGQPRLQRAAVSIEHQSVAPAALAEFDVALSAAMFSYLRDVHTGRIDPRTIGFNLDPPGEARDLASLLDAAIAGRSVSELAAQSRPRFAQYAGLRLRLKQYRALAADRSLEMCLPTEETIRPGGALASAPALWRYLEALGDLAGVPPPSSGATRYEGPLVDAVVRFQGRHGLDADGVLGKKTLAALNVPLSMRVRQIELALERLRWLPDFSDQRAIVVNIPMFHLWAWDPGGPDRAAALGTGVIVGRALRTRTPVFAAEMREVIFRPFWNVPRSILLKEILPTLARKPDYLQRENLEIVDGPGDDASPVAVSPENLDRLRRGSLRLRQRPGPANALGLIKFVFPNQYDVYMHATPAQALFGRSRRDFSHGCVRVENPVSLAEWAFADPARWSREQIVAAMEGTESFHAPLARPIRVVMFYTTAAVIGEDRTIRFADDIYGQDVTLERALARRRSAQ